MIPSNSGDKPCLMARLSLIGTKPKK